MKNITEYTVFQNTTFQVTNIPVQVPVTPFRGSMSSGITTLPALPDSFLNSVFFLGALKLFTWLEHLEGYSFLWILCHLTSF